MLKTLLRNLVWALVLACALPATVNAGTRTVAVDGDRILLGHVVRNAPGHIAGLDMGPAPKPGQKKMFSSKQIRSRLKEAMVPSRGLRIPGPIRVRRPAQNVDEMQLRRLVEHSLKQQLPPGFAIEELMVRGGLVMPRGRVRVDLEMPRKVRRGLQNIKANIFAGQSKPKTTHIRVLLRSDAAANRLLVERGGAVWLRVRAGGVVVSTRAVSQQDGRLGQRVAVMPRQGRKVVYGVVQESGTVEMEL